MLELLLDETIEVLQMDTIDDWTLNVSYKSTTEFISSSSSTNVILAAFVTCWGRLKLYDLISKLGKRCLYFDTDSCFYVERGAEGEFVPKLGSFLGELTDELGHGNYIVEFVSGGPKNYAYKLKDFAGEYRTKTVIKGISMKVSNSKIACYGKVLEKVENYVENKDKSKTVFYSTENHFYRSLEFRIFMTTLHKKYKIEYDKRFICPDYSTLPYGYKSLPVWIQQKRGEVHWKKKLKNVYNKV
jgi:hypothetical protein